MGCSAMTAPLTNQTLYIYNAEHKVVICLPCATAVPEKNLDRHLRDAHSLSLVSQRRPFLAVVDGQQPRADYVDFPTLPAGSSPVCGLPVVAAWACRQCSYIRVHPKQVRRHHAACHPAVADTEPCRPVRAQRWFSTSHFSQYWEVHLQTDLSLTPSDPARRPRRRARAAWLEEAVCEEAQSRDQLKQQHQSEAFQLQAQHQQNDSTPWLERTGWLRHFHDRSLEGLRLSIERPWTTQQLPELQRHWTAPDMTVTPAELQAGRSRVQVHEAVLELVGSAWDAVMDRCVQTLDQTGRSFRLQMSTAGGQGRREQRPLGRLQKPSSEKTYAMKWKKFLYHLFRAAPLAPDRRVEVLGLRLRPREAALLQQLWIELVAFMRTGQPPIFLAGGWQDSGRQRKRRATPGPSNDELSDPGTPRRVKRRKRRGPGRDAICPVSPVKRVMVMVEVRIPVLKKYAVAHQSTGLPSAAWEDEDLPEDWDHGSGQDVDGDDPSQDEAQQSDSDSGSEGFLTEPETMAPFKLTSATGTGRVPWAQRREYSQLTPAMQVWLQESLFELSVEILQNDSASLEGDVFANPLVHFAAILGIQRSTYAFQGPQDYTCHLSALIWVARVLLVEYALPLRAYRTQGWPDRSAYYNQGQRLSTARSFAMYRTHYPMAELLSLLAYGMAINRTQERPGFIQWTPDQQTVHLKGLHAGITMERFRCWVQGVVCATTRLLDTSLLLGLRPLVTMSQLWDHLEEKAPRFSFLNVDGNRLVVGCQALLAICEHPLAGKPLRTPDGWDLPACFQYLQQVAQFLQLLLLSFQLTWGQPARGTEIGTIMWRNSRTAPRNLFVYQGQLMAVTYYHKCRGRTQQSQAVARFLPEPVARMVILYLTHVRPLVRVLLQVTNGLVDDWDQNHALFYLPNQTHLHEPRIQQDQLRRAFQATSTGILVDHGLTPRYYRHLAIAITKKHLPAQATVRNLEEATHFLHNIFAAQAGHSAQINRQVYAVEQAPLVRLVPEQLQRFQGASALWQQFVFEPVSTEAIPSMENGLWAAFRLLDPAPSRAHCAAPAALEQSRLSRATFTATWQYHSLVYYQGFALVLCAICQEAVTHRHLVGHLHLHGITGLAKCDLERLRALQVATLSCSLRRIQEIWLPPTRIFKELTIVSNGLRCGFRGCLAVTLSRGNLRKHIKEQHGISQPREKDQLIVPCRLQAFKRSPCLYMFPID